MQNALHPLIPSVGPDLSRVPVRRPRFTTTEAIILNRLVNADGRTVTASELAHSVGVMKSSISQYIYSIRAKIGEPIYQPQLILTDWPSEDNDRQLGWRYVG